MKKIKGIFRGKSDKGNGSGGVCSPMHLPIKGQFPQLCEYQGRFKEALSAQLSGMRGKKNVVNLKDWEYGIIK